MRWRCSVHLLAAGFNVAGEEHRYHGAHHLQPLQYGGVPLVLEVHIQPKWVQWSLPPSIDELFEAAVESVVPVEGISALPPAHHAVILAAHAWAHEPLGSLRHLIDIAAVCQRTAATEVKTLATTWGIGRVWDTTVAAIEALFLGAPLSWPLRTWARHLRSARERSVLETHLERWLAGFSACRIDRAARMTVRAMQADVRPIVGEDWPTKLRRTRRAIRSAFARRSQH